MEVKLSKKAAKTLAGLDKPAQTRIAESIYDIPKGDIKPLKGTDRTYRLREVIGAYYFHI